MTVFKPEGWRIHSDENRHACRSLPALQEAAEKGLIKIQKYEDMSEGKLSWIEHTMQEEYASAEKKPEYQHFLKGKFSFIK